jgi:hypothetical protein
MEATHWTIGDHEDNVVYEEKIGSGGFGEVHKVQLHLCGSASLTLLARCATQVLKQPQQSLQGNNSPLCWVDGGGSRQ